jgi:hypothetical protein
MVPIWPKWNDQPGAAVEVRPLGDRFLGTFWGRWVGFGAGVGVKLMSSRAVQGDLPPFSARSKRFK